MVCRIIACAVVCGLLAGMIGCAGEQAVEPVVAPEVAKATETPKVETPKVDTPKVETPKVETPKAETPKVEVPETSTKFDPSAVLVSLGDKKLTMQEVLWRSPKPDARIIVSLAKSWTETQLLYAEAEKRGITSLPKAQFIAELNRKYAFAAEVKKEVAEKIEVSDETALAYYEKVKDNVGFTKGSMSLVHITTNTLKEAKDAIKRIEAGEDFKKVCQDVSIADDARRGGKIRRHPYNIVIKNLGSDIFAALRRAKLEVLVGPEQGKNKDTYEIARKTADKPKSFKELKEQIKSQLLRGDQRKALKAFMGTLEATVPGGVQKSQFLIEAEKSLQQKKNSRGRPRTPARSSRAAKPGGN